MNNETVLPVGFDGIFKFTNFTDSDFKAKWGGVEYTFPKNSTSPMIIPNATPVEVQHIRKKFAKELAEREFFKSKKLKSLEAQTPMGSQASTLHAAAVYPEEDLESYVQKCLEPLPISNATAKLLPNDNDKVFKKDAKGNPITRVISEDDSLVGNGTVVA